MKCDVCDSDKGDSMATCTSCNEAVIDDVRARAFKLGTVVGVAIVAMFEAIRVNDSRRKWEAWHERTRRDQEFGPCD